MIALRGVVMVMYDNQALLEGQSDLREILNEKSTTFNSLAFWYDGEEIQRQLHGFEIC